MKKSKRALSALISLLIAATAFAAFPVGSNAASTVGSKYVTYKNYVKNVTVGERKVFSGKFRYPVLTSKSTVAQKLNKHFKKLAEKNVEHFASIAEDDYNNGRIYGNNVYSYNTVVKLMYNAGGKYSFRLVEMNYCGGAHPAHNTVGMTYNKTTGKRFANSALTRYTPATLKNKIVYKIKKEIEKYPTKYFSNALQTVKQRPLNKFNCWLAGSSLHVYFNNYDLAPYMAGPTDIKIKL